MSILLHNGSNAGLFDRLGYLFGFGLDQLALMGGAATTNVLAAAKASTRENNLLSYYAATAPLPGPIATLDGSIAGWRTAQQQLFQMIGTVGSLTVQQMANADTPLPSVTLVNALTLLVQQMVTASASVQGNTLTFGSQTGVGSPVGNPVLVLTDYRGDGLKSQLCYNETLTLKCTGDTGTGSTAGNEPFSLTGQTTYPELDYRWPGGSGCAVALNAVDGSKNNSTGNVLQNSDFATYTTSNYPDNWIIATGLAGTQVLNGTTSNAYATGGGSVEFAGDGATQTAITQSFNTATSTSAGGGGTTYALLPGTVYIFNGYVKVSATPSAGVLTMALTDSAGTILNDAAGNANSFTKSLTAVSTSYVGFSGVFRTPNDFTTVSTPLKLRIKNTTAIDNAKNIFLSRLSLTRPTQLYTGGPYAAVFSGSTKPVNGLAPDQWTMAVNQTYGVFQREFQRYFKTLGMQYNGLPLQLPYAGSPSIPDSYVA